MQVSLFSACEYIKLLVKYKFKKLNSESLHMHIYLCMYSNANMIKFIIPVTLFF